MGEAAVVAFPVDAFMESRSGFEQIVDYLVSDEIFNMKHGDLERELMTRGLELMRNLLQDHLHLRSPGEASGKVIDAEGIEHTHRREQKRELESVFGTVEIPRAGYSVRGSESLHPLDAELNLPAERYSHELRRRAAEEASKGSFDEATDAINRHTGAQIGKRQLEQLVSRAAQDFDAFYEARQLRRKSASETAPLVVITCDGKGVVMRREDLREATRKAAEKRKHKLKKRLSKGEKRNSKRMATVASVYTVAPFVRTPEQIVRNLAPVNEVQTKRRPRPEDKRVWASLEKEMEEVLEDAFHEAESRDPDRAKKWVALVDGNKQQLRLLKKLSRKQDIDLTLVVDIIHVIEYLWKAGTAFHEQASPDLEAWVQERLLRVLQGHASQVAAGMRRSATLRRIEGSKREAVDICASYLLNYRTYLKYDEYLASGLPIATGVIEGACRYLIKDRMDITGARWSLEGAEAVLQLRALRSSKDFDAYWIFHEEKEYERNHAANYADGEAPATIKPARVKRSRLKLL